MADFEIRGAEDFLTFSKALKNADLKKKRAEFHREMKRAVQPQLPKAAAELARGVPGPLKARAARTKQVVKISTGKDPGISVGVQYGKRGPGMGASNARLANIKGLIRHPLFGDRERWFNTPVPGAVGWFDNYWRAHARDALPGVERVMDDFVQQIIREARR